MSSSISNPNELGITLASQLPTELQCHILEILISKFFNFIGSTCSEEFIESTRSNNFQAQLLSMTGHNELLDGIIGKSLNALDLKLVPHQLRKCPYLNKLIEFVLSHSVKLKSVDIFMTFCEPTDYLSNPIFFKLLESHTQCVNCLDEVRNFVNKFDYLDVHFDIAFGRAKVFTHWKLDSSTIHQLVIPTNVAYPRSVKEIEGIEQWCCVPADKTLTLSLDDQPISTSPERIQLINVSNTKIICYS
ncbi:unnamed protein product [Ambrosiozyma monospora]|uniref:Unnamed protein product n=1 Tax=Ambrosiozyma monospora TaxID=43982 RepID=A0ACB5T8V7_AMBMO|nr:unnamed protein product [Ambrosiozyma monospora]